MKLKKEHYKAKLQQREQDLIAYVLQVELIEKDIEFLKKKAK